MKTVIEEPVVIEIQDDFDLQKIAESGQCFRWQNTAIDEFRIIHAGRCLCIRKTGESEYCVDCGLEEFYSIWEPYFDLRENYAQIRARIESLQDRFLFLAAQEQKGVRILRQEPWETLITFIISQNKNIPAIRKSIELLSQTAGDKRADSRGLPYYAFPTPEQIRGMDERDLKACKVGYRWKYIKAAADAVADGDLDLAALAQAGEEETMQSLTSIYGVGVKVANCVSLYGLHHTDAFPMDVWMKRIISNEYSGSYPFLRYSPYNGIYQQYMFAYYRKRYS